VVQRKVVPVDTQFRSYVLLQFASTRADAPQQQASAAPPPSAASLQKQAEAAHRELQSDVATAKEEAASSPAASAAMTPIAPKAVIAFPIGMPPPAGAVAPIAQTAEVPAGADPESTGVLVHPEGPRPQLPAEPPLPATAPTPSIEGNRL
jgi:hypothetical protein